MFLQQRFNYFTPPQFSGIATALLGTTQKWQIDRTWPIEEIVIHVGFTVTTALQSTPNLATNPDMLDNLLQLLQHINLSVNDGKQPRSVVDSSGVGLLEYCQQIGLNLDQATLTLVSMTGLGMSLSTSGVTASVNQTLPVGVYQLTYRIPMVHPWIGEPLRSRFYLPVHTYPQDPVLTLTFGTAANLYASAGAIGSIFTDVELIRRVPTAASEAALQGSAGTNPNGYIDSDLIETPFSIAPGIGSEQRFPLPIPGAYSELVFRQYAGGAYVQRSPIDSTGAGITTGTGFGGETRWRLESGLVVLREWRWKHLRAVNDFSRPNWPTLVAVTATAYTGYLALNGNIGGISPFASSLSITTPAAFRNPTSAHINFLSDGLTGDPGVELGSVLDCNTPANNGLKMEIIGTPASVATNSSLLAVIGRRFFGDLSRWQKFA